ncbi:DNA/RNA non-specific endonuclease [Moraxella nasovis]|uniref:DNA/RNA non-specific endonuclease n=1 Tax=Moraxella nasovis TaxID=2904121 RepID=UPI001F60E44C|nr:DNA/RNA non-specific endonuclease [Moraxella nasovis]UNU73979.1 DNA/RNA non-specific endonuclease [Moraxella nasovis]
MNNMIFKVVIGILVVLLSCLSAHARQAYAIAQDFLACRQNFYQDTAPTFTKAKHEQLSKKTQGLCFHGFAVLHSGVSRTPFWSAEHLTRQRIKQATKLVREDSFRAESRLPHGDRAELKDYTRSGYDRGHLAPNGDMANKSQQFDSFSLANIAPQNGTHNRTLWRQLESNTRHLTNQYGELYVVTGVAFLGKKVNRIGDRVLVPSHFYKAIYIPSEQAAGVYFSQNSENASYEIISLKELANRTGVNAMPALSTSIKSTAYALPRLPEEETQQDEPIISSVEDLTKASSWQLLLLEIFKALLHHLQSN